MPARRLTSKALLADPFRDAKAIGCTLTVTKAALVFGNPAGWTATIAAGNKTAKITIASRPLSTDAFTALCKARDTIVRLSTGVTRAFEAELLVLRHGSANAAAKASGIRSHTLIARIRYGVTLGLFADPLQPRASRKARWYDAEPVPRTVAERKAQCVRIYRGYAEQLGFNPSSQDLHHDRALDQRIKRAFGGWNAFWRETGLRPQNGHRNTGFRKDE